MRERYDYDVAVVGASIAGCTAATLYAKQGARVALIERHASPDAYKTVCTHFVQASAVPTIERLGLRGPLKAAGAVETRGELWTRWGWIQPPPNAGLPASLNVRRETLDPLLRRLAAETSGVDFMPGLTVDRLRHDNGSVAGIEAEDRRRRRRSLSARLVVAADGRDSRVGELAGVKTRTKANQRFGYWAYYRDVPLSSGPRAQLWFLDPDMAYAFPTDGGLTLLACMPTKEKLPQFRANVEQAFTEFIGALPDAPPIGEGERVSKVLGKLNTPSVARGPIGPGLAFVGDAALGSDPLWGVGCGWAFQSAEWLAEATAAAAVGEDDLGRALRRYRRRHRKGLLMHELLIRDYSSGRKLQPAERLLFSAAARDPGLAATMEAFGTRSVPARTVLSPRTLARAARINARHRLRSSPTGEKPAGAATGVA